jgi:uncharacterized integral membrane protein
MMMKTISLGLLSFFVTVAVVIFSAFNAHDVTVFNWFGDEMASWPLAAVVMGGFVLGFSVGGLVVFCEYLSLKAKNRALKRDYQKLMARLDEVNEKLRVAEGGEALPPALSERAKTSLLALIKR